MASQVTRRYNVAPRELRSGILDVLQAAFPQSFISEPAPWHFSAKRGMHWPLTSYGELIDIRVGAPGVVDIRSRYQVPTQLFELGDNHENVERLALALDQYCRTQPSACPACGTPLSPSSSRHCITCGHALLPPSQPALPRRAGAARAACCIVSILLVLLPLVVLLLLPSWIDSQLMLN